MGLIRYEIREGVLPVTVTLVGSGLAPVVHNSYEEGQFTVTKGNYTLHAVDNDGCYLDVPITFCTCPSGYTEVNEGCVKYEQEVANIRTPFETIIARSYPNYTQYGSLIFSSFNIDGTGVYERIDVNNPYWINGGLNSVDGPMNRSCVWAQHVYEPQDIAFSFCIDLLQTKTYYIGVGCDNWSKIKINGEVIIDQGISNGGSLDSAVAPLMAMLSQDSRVTFRNWFIYPVEMKAGRNIVEVFGHNETLTIAGFGIEIYDASANDLKAALSDEDLGDRLLFRSKALAGEDLPYSYSPDDGYRGYYCLNDEEGYALNDCTGPPFCEKRTFIDCE